MWAGTHCFAQSMQQRVFLSTQKDVPNWTKESGKTLVIYLNQVSTHHSFSPTSASQTSDKAGSLRLVVSASESTELHSRKAQEGRCGLTRSQTGEPLSVGHVVSQHKSCDKIWDRRPHLSPRRLDLLIVDLENKTLSTRQCNRSRHRG